jgi:hypothetical protein
MRDGIRISAALNEFSFAAICLTVIACSVGYFYTHREQAAAPPAPCPVVAQAAAPTITIEQTLYIPVPPPAAVVPPDTFTPDPSLDGAPKPEDDQDPVFQHREPVITSALRDPMPQ